MHSRASGVLLHITSLPSRYGIGDLGPASYKFADFLAAARQRYWQVLPLNPPTLVRNPYSPYNCLSAFAGNTLLISPELLYRQGLLRKKDIQNAPAFVNGRVDYPSVVRYKTKLLGACCERFENTHPKPDCEQFCLENRKWLEDYVTFVVLRRRFRRRLWCNWPREIRDGKKQALKAAREQLHSALDRERILQYLFFRQWLDLKCYCNRRGIGIIGDVPIYVAYDSADVWANPEIFELNRAKRSKYIAGVPPDYFSRSGQLWGNPLYNWNVLEKKDYGWWQDRMRAALCLFDLVRMDHFRGFVAYWQVPAGARTAAKGRWVQGPGEDFLSRLLKVIPSRSIIAEDLGHITPDVRDLIRKFHLTGMRVLQFAFTGDANSNPNSPANHIQNCVLYTGTHDNNTIKAWFEKEAGAAQKKRLFECLGRKVPPARVPAELIRLAMSSVAGLVIIPMQDILGLGEEARMNRPAAVRGNWSWRLDLRRIPVRITRKLARWTESYGRG
jgi:4-alpha-glucanotransferase